MANNDVTPATDWRAILFRRLPKWVLAFGAVTAIFLFAILALSPPIAFGRIDCSLKDGRRCGAMSLTSMFKGHELTTSVKSSGAFFSMLSSKFSPQNIALRMRIDGIELNYPHPIILSATDIWCEREFWVKIRQGSSGKFEAPVVTVSGGNWLTPVIILSSKARTQVSAVVGNFFSSANAAELMTYDQFQDIEAGGLTNAAHKLPSASLNPLESSAIDKAVKSAAERVLQSDSGTLDFRYMSSEQINTFNQELSVETGLAIPPEHWDYIESSEAASAYVKSLKVIGIDYAISTMGEEIKPWSIAVQEAMKDDGNALVLVPSSKLDAVNNQPPSVE